MLDSFYFWGITLKQQQQQQQQQHKLYKKRGQLAEDWFGTPIFTAVSLFWYTNMSRRRHVTTL